MPYNEITAIRPGVTSGQAVYADALTAWRLMARVAETRAGLSTQTIPSNVAAIFALGRSTAGDGLHSVLLRSGSDPGGERVQSADGAWWGEVAASGPTNLSNTPASATLDVESSTGSNTTLPAATTSLAGVMTAADKTKIDGLNVTAVNAQTGTTYTLVLGDANDIVTMDNASANVLTIPPNSSVAFTVGTVINVIQLGAGATSVTAGSGVTLNGVSTGSGALDAQYAACSMVKLATDTWHIGGGIGTVA